MSDPEEENEEDEFFDEFEGEPEDDDDLSSFRDVVFAIGFEEAVIGVAQQYDRSFVLYDYEKVQQILQREMTAEEALTFFTENILSNWFGKETPAYLIKKVRDPGE